MIHRKQVFSRIFFAMAVAIIVVPVGVSLVLEFGFQVRTTLLLYQWGIDPDWFIPGIFFGASFLYFAAATMQFPFKEEENWTCACGYDLSFLRKKTVHCPECGTKILWEWTPKSGHYSRGTARRMGWTILLFLLSGTMLCIGLLLQWASRLAEAG
jgi:DNA-directed RNA polymerase subunit RPC12/RpoP